MRKVLPLIIICALACVCACKSAKQTKEIPVVLKNASIDSVSKSTLVDKTFIIRDTFLVVVNSAGDTIREKEIHNQIQKERITDTLLVVRIDTIRVPVQVRATIEKAVMPKWGIYALISLTAMCIGLIIAIWLIKKREKQE